MESMLVSLGVAQTWRPEINENIWNSLLLFKRLLFSRELLYIHINFPPNTLTVQTAKYQGHPMVRFGEYLFGRSKIA